MARYTAIPVTSGFGSQSNLNANFEAIEDAINDMLDRTGGTGNQMESDLDMNSNTIFNAASISTASLTINGQVVVANETFVTELPDPVGQGGKFVKSDGAAASWQNIDAQDVARTVITVDTIADMKALTGLADGVTVRTTRYFSGGSLWGGGDYLYRATPTGTDDGFIYHDQTTGGGQFELTSASPNVYQAGVAGDGVTDDTARAIAYLNSDVPEKLLLDATLLCATLAPSGSVIRIFGGTIKLKNSTNDRLLNLSGFSTVVLEGVTFDGNHQNQSFADATVGLGIVDNAKVHGCTFINGQGNVLDVDSVDESIEISNCLFKGGREHTNTVNQGTQYISIRTDSGHLSDEPQFVNITGNTFIGITPSVAGRGVGGVICASNTSATATQGHKLTIADNTFYKCGQDNLGNKIAAIAVYRRGPYSFITGNKILFGDERGIDVQGSDNVTVANNTIHGTTGSGIVFATRDTTKDCSNAIITGNQVTGITAAWGIDAQGYQTGTTAKNITVCDNIIKDCKYSILISDYLDSIIVTGNTFNGATTTSSSADEQAVSILGTRGTPGTFKSCGLIFANNQINNSANSTLIQDMAYPVSITGNSWNTVSTSKIALSFIYSSSSVSIVGNSFNECGVFTSVQQCSGNVIENSNSFNDSNTTIRSVTFKNNTGNILCDGNIMKSVANDIVEFSACSGRNMLSNNVGPAGSTVRVATSTVTQTNNLFT